MKSHGIWRFEASKWVVHFSLIFGAILWLGVVLWSWAEASPSLSAEASESEEYNFSWLDPDKKIYVLQNRKYLKGERPSLSLSGGLAAANAYRNTTHLSGEFSYYFSEEWGIAVFYSHFFNQENNTFDHLKIAAPNALPVVREVRSQFGLNFHFVPWYAKINVFDQILYFDWYFAAGAGSLRTALDQRTSISAISNFKKEDFFSIFLSTGHQYHLSRDFFIRIDYTSALYRALSAGDQGELTWFSSNLFGIGLGLRL